MYEGQMYRTVQNVSEWRKDLQGLIVIILDVINNGTSTDVGDVTIVDLLRYQVGIKTLTLRVLCDRVRFLVGSFRG